FDATTALRLAEHLKRLLRTAASEPECDVWRLPILSDSERQALVVEWNGTSADYPERCIHELFEVRADERPDAVALICEGHSITYASLDGLSNHLANHLLSFGVGLEQLVGVCLERSPEAVVSMLAVLKTGAAFVPLDPAYPRDRLRFMFEDSGSRLVVTTAA